MADCAFDSRVTAWTGNLALLWQIFAADERDGIPKSVFQFMGGRHLEGRPWWEQRRIGKGAGSPAVRHAIVDLIMRPLQRCPNCRQWVRAGLQPKLNLPK